MRNLTLKSSKKAQNKILPSYRHSVCTTGSFEAFIHFVSSLFGMVSAAAQSLTLAISSA
jgi:hypothetical protein